LLRILHRRRIQASTHLVRDAQPVCCFTERTPRAVRALNRYSRGQRRWSFEPYAIGFGRGYAIARGLQPVLHLPRDQFRPLDDAQRFRYQRFEPPGCDWTAEGEWRCRGDFDFGDAGPEDVVLLVPSASEAAWIAAQCPFPVVLIGDSASCGA
jgi:hypothetical protein